MQSLQEILAARSHTEPVPTAVVYPCSEYALRGAAEAAAARLIVPTLVGPADTIQQLASQHDIDLTGCNLVNAPDGARSATAAVALVNDGKATILMKGSLHTDLLLRAILERERGLRTNRRISHVFALDLPEYPRLLLVTDGAINIAPSLEVMEHIVANAVDLAHSLGITRPKVALLSAVETVHPHIESTCIAATLCKMAERGQIKGAVLDGPLAMDNAVSLQAARAKGIDSTVAGEADILVVPNLEAGNMLVKGLIHLAGATSAGVLLGAKVPVVLTSRAEPAADRMASCALAIGYADYLANNC